MKIKDFPYGIPTKTLKKAVQWLNSNKRKLEKKEEFYSFDYPEYWDMPKTISNRLNTDEVDWIQNEVHNWKLQGRL